MTGLRELEGKSVGRGFQFERWCPDTCGCVKEGDGEAES